MVPETIERERLLLAGVIDCGKSVGDIDIQSLWGVYAQLEPGIPNRIEGAWYELHVGSGEGDDIYSVTAGAGIREIGELPVEVSLKTVPAGKYLHFAHAMKDGGYGEAFARVFKWIGENGTKVRDFGLQLYDSDFNPEENKDSILHIYMPIG